MAKTRQVSKSTYERLAAFRYALRQFLHFSEEAANAAGITPQQHQALLAIKGFPDRDQVTVGELAERLQLRHHSTVGLIDRLVGERLAVRTISGQDRRRVFVVLTARGEKMLARLSTAHSEQLRRLAPELKLRLEQLTKSRQEG
jgi:DNA-binding MarR family transcriptional regulator